MQVISTEDPGVTSLPGYAAALFLGCMMLYNNICIRKMEGERWWRQGLDQAYLDNHPIAYKVFRLFILTDMELVALLPWKPSGNTSANGFPLDAAKQGRFNSHVEDGVQVSIQVVYLLLLGEMDWATLPSMLLSAFAFIFRVYVAIDQSLTEDNQGNSLGRRGTSFGSPTDTLF